MNETNLIGTVRGKRVPVRMKRERPKKSWDKALKEDMKRGLNFNDGQNIKKWRRSCRRVVDPSNWEGDADLGRTELV